MTHLNARAGLVCRIALASLALTGSALAITDISTLRVLNDTNNRPFFSLASYAANPDITNPAGYSGSVAPGTTFSTTVTGLNVGEGGSDSNGIPLGVGITFDVSFTIAAVDPAKLLSDDTGNAGLGVNTAGESATNSRRINPGETLSFSTIQITNASIYDPLGQLLSGATVNNPLWTQIHKNNNNNSPTVLVSANLDGTGDPTSFGPGGVLRPIYNDPNAAQIETEPLAAVNGVLITPLASMYVNTQTGSSSWPLKEVAYQVSFNYDLAPVPATRRSFKFGDPTASYDNTLTHQITADDTTITITPTGNVAVLNTNSNGVGVNSTDDDLTAGNPTGTQFQRYIDGSLPTPESIQFSFDKDVSFESLTLGNLDLNNTEGVVLKFISGTNPFTGLSGYSGDYTLGSDSLTFQPNTTGQTPFMVPYGMNGQSELLITAGTVLSLTSGPVAGNGFLLDMITVNVPGGEMLTGDYNENGTVDAADYVLWRKNNINGPQGYTDWSANFGKTAGDGASANSLAGSSAIPEPGTFVLVAAFGMLSLCRRHTLLNHRAA